MNPFASLSLKIKLPLFIVSLCLAAVASVQLENSIVVRSTSQEDSLTAQRLVADRVEKELNTLLEGNATALRTLAAMPTVMDGMERLKNDTQSLADPMAVLQKAYVTDNPNPAGKRQLLDAGQGMELYHADHAALHPSMRTAQELNGFYDLFLFDSNMRALYTVFKESDFMADFKNGPLASSTLADVVNKARSGRPGDVFISDFAEYAPSNNAPAAFMATQVVDRQGNTIGVIAAQLSIDAFAAVLKDTQGLGETGEAFIVGTDMRAKSASRFEGGFPILAKLEPLDHIVAAASGTGEFLDNGGELTNGNDGVALVKPITIMGTRWGLVVERDMAEVLAPSNDLLGKVLVITALIAAVCLGVSYMIARWITAPVGRIAAALTDMSNDNLQVSVVDSHRKDEMGDMAKALGALLATLNQAKIYEAERAQNQRELSTVIDVLSVGLQDLSHGDLTRPINDTFSGDYDRLRVDFNATLQTLSDTMGQVVDASQSIRARSTEISTASEDLSRRTENQAAALEETAAALDELTASIRSAADGAREVETIVRQARQEAENSGIVVEGAVAAMSEIEKSSQQISQIIGAIDDIAFQTNLLALNAGVEAARAGDAGKGFAVVASEVRALAQRSSAAAKEIKSLISASAQYVGRGVDQVGKAGEALHNIVGSVANISSLVSNIASGAAEQSTGLAEINIGVTQLDQVTQQNAAMVEQSIAASHSLHQDATGLATLVAKFKVPQAAATKDRVVSLSQFLPLETGAMVEDDMTGPSAKAVKANAKPMWQDF